MLFDLLRIEVPDPGTWRASTDYSIALVPDNVDFSSAAVWLARHDSFAIFLGAKFQLLRLSGRDELLHFP
jgi:hypothetical protein